MNRYEQLKNRQQEEYNKFPVHFAIGDEQLQKKLQELNVKEEEIDEKLVGIGFSGFVLKEDYPKYKEMLERHHKELQNEIENDTDGSGFIKDMFSYELANHEYGYTRELDDTFAALGLIPEDFADNLKLNNGLDLAIREINEAEKIYEYVDTVKTQLDEKLENGWLSQKEYNIASKMENMKCISKSTLDQIGETTSLDEELHILDQNIRKLIDANLYENEEEETL